MIVAVVVKLDEKSWDGVVEVVGTLALILKVCPVLLGSRIEVGDDT